MGFNQGITRRAAVAALASGLAVASIPAFAQSNAAPIRIGMGIALSGGLAAFGKSALLAMQLWAEDRERQGRPARAQGRAGLL